MTKKSCKHLYAKYCTAVSTSLGIISSAHRNLHVWRSNQQPQHTEAETLPLGHRFILHIIDVKWSRIVTMTSSFSIVGVSRIF